MKGKEGDDIGGVIGRMVGERYYETEKINDCYNLINIQAEDTKNVGGICGYLNQIELEKC